MIWVRKSCLALIAGSVLSTLGCCYHAQQFGRTRDIGWGEIGCDTCKSGGGCGPTGCGPKATCAEPGCAPTMVTKEPPQGNSTFSVSLREPSRNKGRDIVEVHKTEKSGSDLPIYVLSPECVSSGIIVNPNPVQTVVPASARTITQETVIRDVAEKN